MVGIVLIDMPEATNAVFKTQRHLSSRQAVWAIFSGFCGCKKASNLRGLGKEGLDVSVLVEGRPCLPDPKQNTDPTICKFA
jgi:hypothetical protein